MHYLIQWGHLTQVYRNLVQGLSGFTTIRWREARLVEKLSPDWLTETTATHWATTLCPSAHPLQPCSHRAVSDWVTLWGPTVPNTGIPDHRTRVKARYDAGQPARDRRHQKLLNGCPPTRLVDRDLADSGLTNRDALCPNQSVRFKGDTHNALQWFTWIWLLTLTHLVTHVGFLRGS